MKKFLTLILLALTAFGLVFCFTACGGHEHQVSNWTVTVQPTCTQEGSRTGICDVCGEEVVETLEMIPHSLDDWTITKTATCTEEGSRERSCEFCEYKETEVLQMVPHTEVVLQVEVPASCNHVGYTAEIICEVCNETLQERVEIEALPHTFGEWEEILAPTCQLEGRKERVCEVCSHVEMQDISRLDHEFSAWAPDPDNPGQHVRKCNNCTTTRTEACHYGDEVTINATCNNEGKKYQTCLDCGNEIIIEKYDQLKHKLEYRQVIENENGSHTKDEHKHYQVCVNNGCTYQEEPVACEFTTTSTEAATCTTPEYTVETCTYCKAVHETVTSPATGHSWDTYEPISFYPLTSKHRKVCSKCHASEEEYCSVMMHESQPTCEKEGLYTYRCEKCENTRSFSVSPKLGHILAYKFSGTTKDDAKHTVYCSRPGCTEFVEYDEGCHFSTTSTPQTCTADEQISSVCDVCSKQFTESGTPAGGHEWIDSYKPKDSESHSRKCRICGYEDVQQHNCRTETLSATCETDKVIKEICDDCGSVIGVEEEPDTKLGHSWNIVSISKDNHVAECSTCKRRVEGNHNWEESNLCSVCNVDGLEYRIEGKHAIVTGGKHLNTAKTKKIIINPYYKELKDDGQYDVTEYSVTSIGNTAFYNFDHIVEVTLPYTLETISRMAFDECSNLKNVTLISDAEHPASLTRIEGYAFYYDVSLQTFLPPETLKYIGEYAFSNCRSLHDIRIPDSVEDIEPSAFLNTQFTNDSVNWEDDMLYLGKHLIKVRNTETADGYTNTTVTVEEGTLTIAARAFAECTHVEKVILPKTLTHIDRDAFLNCTNLHEVEFTGDIYEWLSITYVNDYSSPLCYGGTGLHIDHADGVVDLTDPEKVTREITHIPAGTFMGTEITSIILPKTLKSIGEKAFANCASLNSISFQDDECNVSYVGKDVLMNTAYYDDPKNWDGGNVLYLADKIVIKATQKLSGAYTVKEGTTVIVAGAFKNCPLLTSVTIAGSMLYVGADTFDFTKLSNLTFSGESAEYVWICYNPTLKISRGFTGSSLNATSLASYCGEWKRSYKDA